MKRLTSHLLLSLCCLLPLSSLGEKAAPWYQVEIIVFTQQDLYGDEKHRTNLQLSYPENWLALRGSAMQQATPDGDGSIPPRSDAAPPPAQSSETPFTLLDSKQFKLGPEDYTLGRAPGYRVLLHWAWRQPGLGIEDSPWVLIAGGESYGDHRELEGSVRLVLNRYLHFQADLWHSRFGQPRSTTGVTDQPTGPETSTAHSVDAGEEEQTPGWPALPTPPWRKAPATNDAIDESVESAWRYEKPQFEIEDMVSLEQSSRLQLGELTYLDHPNMGVLIHVSRYQVTTP